MRIPRVMITAPASGGGKTTVTCGLLQALKERGKEVVSFKCGPDYIDPMFHSRVIGMKSRNLDTYFTDEGTTRYLLQKNAQGADLAVIEGVMGYYDGLGGTTDRGSAWEVAGVTRTPAILLVNMKGMSLSAGALIRGFMGFRKDHRIGGVILNRLSPMLYPRLKEVLEKELGVPVLGYVPELKDFRLESRHLGLVLPDEIEDLKGKLHELAEILEKSIDIDALIKLAEQAEEMEPEPDPLEDKPGCTAADGRDTSEGADAGKEPVTIAVSRDEAFCFLYEDNLDLLRRCGARLVFFSPLHDKKLPDCDGLLLCGGYPELFAKGLSLNGTMRRSVKEALEAKLPCMAECGGFMYLMEEMEDMDGQSWPMAGALTGKAFRTQRLGRFGYISLTPGNENNLGGRAGQIRGHEFHYFDTTDNGDTFTAEKPVGKRSWACIRGSETLMAGFPHLYYYSNPGVPAAFVQACRERRGSSGI